MKRIICLMLVVLSVVTLLAACSKDETFTCDYCGKEVTGKKNVITYEGESGSFCDDCKEEVEALLELAEALGGL